MTEVLHKGKKYTLVVGQIINNFKVLRKGEKINSTFKVICECTKCGIIKSFTFTCLKRESTTQCSCSTPHKHGGSKDKLYKVWGAIKSRCYNERNPSYHYYGGRGIRVCQSWLEDYKCFKNWSLVNGYGEGLSIERVDVNGDYCPENCCWIPLSNQTKNQRKRVNNSSGFTGVFYNKIRNNWCAVWREGKNIKLRVIPLTSTVMKKPSSSLVSTERRWSKS